MAQVSSFIFELLLVTLCSGEINQLNRWTNDRSPIGAPVMTSSKQRHTRDAPKSPRFFTGTVRSNSEVLLTWAPPATEPGTPTTYVIGVKRSDSMMVDAIKPIKIEGYDTTRYQVKGLNSSTVYVFTIRTQTSAGSSMDIKSDPVRTLDERPSKVEDLRVHEKTARSLVVKWEKPLDINGRRNLTGYVIYTRSKDWDNCSHAIAIVYKQTLFHWDPEDSLCKLPVGKDLERRFLPYLTQPVTMNVTGLESHVQYDVMVTAYNSFGPGQPSHITETTLIDVPSEPRHLTGRAKSNSEIFMTWDPPARYPGPTNYIINMKRNESLSSFGDGETVNISGYSRTSYLVNGLNSSTMYVFSIMAQTSAGQSSKTLSNPIRTWDERPDKVQDLKVTNKTDSSILIQWEKPLHTNGRGKLTAYVIYVRAASTNKDSFPCSYSEAVVFKEQEFHHNKRNSFCQLPADITIDVRDRVPAIPVITNVTGLDPYVKYDVMVTAYNTLGAGQPSVITEWTAIGVPSEPSELTGTVQSNSEILLKWTPPAINPGPMTYVIKVKPKDSGSERSIEVVGYAKKSYLVSGLATSTVYMFGIMARTSAGQSPEAMIGPIRTWNERPDKVQSLMVLHKTNDSIELQWKQPLHINGRGHLAGFVVYSRINDTQGADSRQCISVQAIVYNKQQFQFDKSFDSFCQVVDGSLLEHQRSLSKSPITLILSNLVPYVKYDIMVISYNTFGPGTEDQLTATTDMALQCHYPSHRVLAIEWNPPTADSGPVAFDIDVDESKLPRATSKGFLDFYHLNTTANSSVEIPHTIRSYWTYVVSVTPTTQAGDRLPKYVVDCFTPNFGEASGQVQFFNVSPVSGNVHVARVTFECPKVEDRHGAIQGFIIEADSLVTHMEEYVESKQPSIQRRNPVTDCAGPYQRDIPIVPDLVYTFQVRVQLINVTALGEPVFRNFSTTTKSPPPMNNVLSQVNDKNVSQVSDVTTENAFTIHICKSCVLNSSHGEITSVGVIVCPDVHCNGDSLKTSRVRTWRDARASHFNISYMSTGTDWIHQIKDSQSKSADIAYTVGSDKSCEKILSGYCNGPLPPNTQFWVKMFSCTKAGCTSSNVSGPFTTPKILHQNTKESSKVSIIAGAVAGVVAVIIVMVIIVIVVIIRKRRERLRKQPSRRNLVIKHTTLNPDIPLYEIPVRPGSSGTLPEDRTGARKSSPITIGNFENRIFELRNNELLLNREFRDLEKMSPAHGAIEGSSPQNRKLNPWPHIIPYDFCRVKLNSEDSYGNLSDYINASFIPGFNKSKQYIITQGPSQDTMDDFWTMVWEQGVCVIVMLAEFKEKNNKSSVRVHRYIPRDGESNGHQYGNINVNRQSKKCEEHWEKRSFKITNSKTGKHRYIKHFLFKTWSDSNALIDPNHLIKLMRTVNDDPQSGHGHPLVVHCSNGIGRTGTFLAVDYLNDYLEDVSQQSMSVKVFSENTVDIFLSVLKLRNFRKMLVETRAQYSIVYEAVLLLITDKLENFHSHQNYVDVDEEDDEKDDDGSHSNHGEVYEDIEEYPPPYSNRSSGDSTPATHYINESVISLENESKDHDDTTDDNDTIYEEFDYTLQNHRM